MLALGQKKTILKQSKDLEGFGVWGIEGVRPLVHICVYTCVYVCWLVCVTVFVRVCVCMCWCTCICVCVVNVYIHSVGCCRGV